VLNECGETSVVKGVVRGVGKEKKKNKRRTTLKRRGSLAYLPRGKVSKAKEPGKAMDS